MNTPASSEALAAPPAETSSASKPSRLIRRIHMFSALFLGPWMVMYALSTLVMAHRELITSLYSTKNPAIITERELNYSRSISTNSTREQIAEQILQDLGLSGTHYVSGGKDGKPLVIHRQHALTPQHITFDPEKNKILLQREEFRASNFLERMHRRRGYNAYKVENTWGFTVDVAVVTMVFWCLSGLWLWWELKMTWRWGAIAFSAGSALFLIFLLFS